ncbi:hypothetical protein TNIN_152301 [Trichonephila inaurata madagascariensis]|uniref:Uncharacterized protein n=1 Tax=Trichonephila inaurata madagascariensis TaxID=2747483 RepID=A0A8X7CPQ7_9ARAC|nr:hypothetical protein TNIN_152301 [Trichonephila inaurata madagascariensis]
MRSSKEHTSCCHVECCGRGGATPDNSDHHEGPMEPETEMKERLPTQEKKLSSGSLGGGESARPKHVTVHPPGTKSAKPTVKKKSIRANLDVPRELLKCKEEGSDRLDLSKSNVSLSS